MIAQRRVSENLAPLSWHTYHRGDSLYRGPAVHCCLRCMLPTGLEMQAPSQIAREAEWRTDIPNNRCFSTLDAGGVGPSRVCRVVGSSSQGRKLTLSSSSHHEPATGGSLPLSQAGRNAILLFSFYSDN